jgi:Uma2 family endonuclease
MATGQVVLMNVEESSDLRNRPNLIQRLEGTPILAVNLLSLGKTYGEINEKIDEYIAAGVAQLWVIDSHWRTVTVYRRDAEPVLYNVTQELTAEPQLPGFRAQVVDLFN